MRNDRHAAVRSRDVYWLVALVALAMTAGRIAVFQGPAGDTAFGSANDRSRWSTIASLVERGTYAIDSQIAIAGANPRNKRPWDTIDKVRHVGRDGKQHYYSSKPPLLATLVAGVYAVVRLCSGLTLTEQPLYVTRIVLLCVNIPLMALFFYGTINSVDRLCRSQWARIVAALGTCFGTMLLPFGSSLNNHLPAAAATALVLWIFVRASERLGNSGDAVIATFSRGWWFLAGLAAAMAVANELPAMSMFVLWLVLFWYIEKSSSLPFLSGAAVVAIAFFGTNWIAHQSLRPPYAHRGDGRSIAQLAAEIGAPDQDLVDQDLVDQDLVDQARLALIAQGLAGNDAQISITPSDEADRRVIQVDENRYSLVFSDDRWNLNAWDNWYDYPGTYWKDGVRKGVDRGEPSRIVYFLQMMIGHHGVFSLTPLWFLVPVGLVTGLRSSLPDYRRLNWAILLASLACILFYLSRPLIDRNYGGVSVCFRWLLWLTPLWIAIATPVIEDFGLSKLRRSVIYVLLATSVFSVAASLETPWEHPWIYRFWQFLGWLSG